MEYREILRQREQSLDQAADYVGEALNIIQDMLWRGNETEAMKRKLNDLYDEVFNCMLKVRAPLGENPDEQEEEE